MKHKIQVAMLPTEYITPIVLHSTGLDKVYHSVDSAQNAVLNIGGVCQYLYITVPQDVEPIKEGDWCIFNGKVLAQATSRHGELGNPFNRRKIIATNDPKLTVETELGAYYRNGIGGAKKIPQLQQSFLKEFVANPDGEFEVEYEKIWVGYEPDEHDSDFQQKQYQYYLKLNQDNEVTITSVEEKMYCLEDLEQSCMYFANTTYVWTMEEVKDWIKENL